MNNPEGDEDLPPFNEYGLCFDYVEPGTFTDQTEGYHRYQLSWGGPSEEFRIYRGRVEFWFLDWFDGAYRDVSHREEVQWLVQFFEDVGML